MTIEIGPAIYVGAVAPEGIVINVTPQTVGAPTDLSTVTGAVLHMTDPNGNDRLWTAQLSNQTPTTLTVSYAFQAGDIDTVGTWYCVARLLLSSPVGGVRRVEKFSFPVEPE